MATTPPSANASEHRWPPPCTIEATDLEELNEKLIAQGLTIIDPLADRPWGQSEFTVADPDGNWLTFWKSPQTTQDVT